MDIEDSITQFEDFFEGTPWYGPAMLTSLEEIPAEFWDQRIKNASHTITELVYHMLDWRVFFIEKLKGNQLFSIEMNSEKDWRKNIKVTTKEEKQQLLGKLKKSQDVIIELLGAKPDTWMTHVTEGKDYKNEYMTMGAVQHDIYHLGQVNFLYAQLKNNKKNSGDN